MELCVCCGTEAYGAMVLCVCYAMSGTGMSLLRDVQALRVWYALSGTRWEGVVAQTVEQEEAEEERSVRY
eukprot:3773380-Rhodomonas_salina.1